MEARQLVDSIVEAIQEQKGKHIVLADLSHIGNTICRYLVICEGTSNTHVSAIADNVKDHVRKNAGEKPLGMEGLENCLWVVADYGDVMVHVMQREPREFYDLEHLWEDAVLSEIEDQDD